MDAKSNDDVITAPSSVPLPPPPPPASSSAARRVWWALPTLTIAWLLMLSVVVASFVPMQLWELAPGSAESVSERMTFGDDVANFATRYPTEGDTLFVTALGSKLSLLDAFTGWIDDDVEILTFTERFGTQTPAQQRAANSQAMVSSKQIAEFVAFTRLGIESEFAYGDVVIDELVCEDAPRPQSACQQLLVDDVIITFDGRPTPTLPSLIDVVSAKKPGDVVAIEVLRGGAEEPTTVQVELIAAPDDSGRTIIGIMPRDTRTVKTPFEIGIDTDSIGGPSGGLAFTLALLDELSSGSLTGGTKVAVTGTINGDETVGAIGAVRQKAVAARAAGARLFLIPASQSAADITAARKIGGATMRVETVATLQDALDILQQIGGDPFVSATPND
ncbi:MAG: PDZ domain-containing protein [Acidimicrobiia bacterium]|nr:PDZ domain-containing protein [Acidimicrobiia bacterium]